MSCNDKNILTKEGTSLFNRVLAALNTAHAKIDERQNADLILFAKKYAHYLNYFDNTNNSVEDWEPLMKMDASVALAELVKLDSRKIYDYRLFLYKNITLAAHETVDADKKTKDNFKYLFDFLFSLVSFIDEQYSLIPAELTKKDVLKGTISSKMAEALTNLLFIFNTLSTIPLQLIDTTVATVDENNAPVKITSCKDFNAVLLDEAWINTPPLSYLITDSINIPAKTVSFTEKDQVIWLINHNLFNAQIDNLFKGITFLITRAGDIFNQVIADYPKHSPHYALFLSFIKLFRYAQDDLNRYTQRHLDYYYKDTLQQKNKKPLPDAAHLTFELQKPIQQRLLKKGSAFKGGKDITGKEINYSLSEDIVLNKATVAKLHSWQLINDGNKNILKSSTIANSDDGISEKLSSVDKSWFTFGDPKKIENAITGFGIVSNLLLLGEGTRTIIITVNFTSPIDEFVTNPGKYDKNCFTTKITGPKGWYDAKKPTVEYVDDTKLKFTFGLGPSEPAFIPYNEKIHKSQLDFALPVLKIYLEQDIPNAIPYELISKKQVSSINIYVKAEAVKNLVLSHDTGSIDAAKPFKPFGDFPGDDSALYIGSKEIFQKQLSSIHLGFDWKAGNNPNLKDAAYLNDGKWNAVSLINDNIVFSEGSPFTPTPVDLEKNSTLLSTSLNGFLRIRNATDFSYGTYLSSVSEALKSTAVTKEADSEIYTLSVAAMPVASEIVLNNFFITYEASTVINFPDGTDHTNHIFFHFTPFGYTQEFMGNITLLTDIIYPGELFIGFENAQPELVINVLFQVADGSSNPLKKMESVSWYYLSENNTWKIFEKTNIIDRTNNLTQSAIVTLTLPGDISDENTGFQKKLYWIKATVQQNTDAVCKLILVKAQAALVTLVQNETKKIEFRQQLPAASISKLVTSDAAIKTITQPFDSFDGRIRETDEHFYVRTSERLRHKQRAITMWDYEHMVLEQFQSIFKVKCLNHTGIYKVHDDEVFCEHYPGHVTIIPISNQQNKVNVNPLKPYTSIGLLNNIADFLNKTNSPFVKLHVINPQFEEVQLDFKVKFYDHLDEAFYKQQLDNDIERFLCPWAFEQDKEISFGGIILKSVLLNFVEERPYVDYVSCFKMNHIIKRDDSAHMLEKQDVEEAIPTTSRSLLVSYFNEETKLKHIIVPGPCDC